MFIWMSYLLGNESIVNENIYNFVRRQYVEIKI